MEKIVNFVSLILVVLVGAYAALNINQLRAKMEETQGVMLMMAEKIGDSGNVNVQQSVNQAVEVVAPQPQVEPTAAPEVGDIAAVVEQPVPNQFGAPSYDPGQLYDWSLRVYQAIDALSQPEAYERCVLAGGNCAELKHLYDTANAAPPVDPSRDPAEGTYIGGIQADVKYIVDAMIAQDANKVANGIGGVKTTFTALGNYFNVRFNGGGQ